MSEDCLTLNVWTPASNASSTLPVMVWFHSGGFFRGGSARADTDGTALARQGVVVVSVNYRLGVFGFLAHPALSKESAHHSSGNYGLLDQIAALQWVQRNISAFGGDRAGITVFGESAGGCSVLYLLISPLAKGLFARGISQSAGLIYYPTTHRRRRWYGRDAAEQNGLRLGSDVARLRATPALDLLEYSATRTNVVFGQDGVEYFPIVDGWVIPDDPASLYDAGRFARVPLLLGSNADEGTLFVVDLPIKTVKAWHDYAAQRFGAGAGDMLSQYPAATDDRIVPAAVRMVTDWVFLGTNRAVARAVAARGSNVYRYLFSRVNRGLEPFAGAGAFHGAEIPYVFRNPMMPQGEPVLFAPLDARLSDALSAAWVRFARTGDPNGAGLPTWPRFEPSTDRHLEFGDRIRVDRGLRAREVDVFDRAFARMRQRRD